MDYEKWYTDEQVEAIIQNLRTYRDKAVFSISLDGLRVDEILSSRIDLYSASDGTLKLARSKGRSEGAGRLCVLSERSRNLLEEYLYNERSIVEQKLIEAGLVVPLELFLNLREREGSFGKPMAYHNTLEIIKRAAKRAGLDPAKIRTHSGRSTKAGELFRIQAKNPEKMTDNQILEIMGWKSMTSAEPYKNRQDRETAVENWKRLETAKTERHADD
ncbi:MAG: tyrosine-type recombinase/integrase [Coriobacteriales bacterium]